MTANNNRIIDSKYIDMNPSAPPPLEIQKQSKSSQRRKKIEEMLGEPAAKS